MKIKLIEYPFGRDLGLQEKTVYFIQTEEKGSFGINYVMWHNDSVAYVGKINGEYSGETLKMAALLDYKTALQHYEKIKAWFIEQRKKGQVKTLKEAEIPD